MAGPFYFAWVDNPAETTETETSTFLPEYAREDEDVFSVILMHEEGDFPALTLTIRNPRIGLLGPGRKRWAWLSFKNGSEVVPLFFGRLVGIPNAIQGEKIELQFVAKPADYLDQKEAVAEAMRVAPFYDPLLLSEDGRQDPDAVLEGYGALWHIDRITHEVTASNIITGEDGTLNIGEAESLYDITDIQLSGSPARKAVVRASVTWQQSAYGVLNITQLLKRAFTAIRPPTASDVNGNPLPWNDDNAYLMGASGMESAWPAPGVSLGGGWEVFQSTLNFVGRRYNGDLVVAPRDLINKQTPQNALPGRGILLRIGAAPGIIVDTNHYNAALDGNAWTTVDRSNSFLWIPIIPTNPFMSLAWESQREYTEELTFALSADVQDVISEAGDDEVISLDYGNVRVDTLVAEGDFPIGDVKRRAYFPTTRGRATLSTLIAVARANLLSRARVAQITVGCPFSVGLNLSCRMSAVITDRRFPDGQIAGKISAYTLSFDGESGASTTEITVSACVGRGGTVSAVDGDPTYVAEDYTGEEYQLFDGGFIVPIAGEVSYSRNSVLGVRPNDDRRSITQVDRRFVKSIVVTGGIDEQVEAAEGEGDTLLELWGGGSVSLKEVTQEKPTITGLFGTSVESARDLYGTIDTTKGGETPEEVTRRTGTVITKVRVEMVPIEGGPFFTSYDVDVTDLKIPKTINLEAV